MLRLVCGTLVMLSVGLAWGFDDDVLHFGIKGINQDRNGNFQISFTRSYEGNRKKDTQNITLHDHNGIATMAVMQTMLLEISDRSGHKGRPKNMNAEAPSSQHAKRIMIDALRKAESFFIHEARNQRLSRLARERLLAKVTELRRLRDQLGKNEIHGMTYSDLEFLGQWLERNVPEHAYQVTYIHQGQVRRFNGVTFDHPIRNERFLNGAFTMRTPQYRVRLQSADPQRPQFHPELNKILDGYLRSVRQATSSLAPHSSGNSETHDADTSEALATH